MIELKSSRQIEKMRQAGVILKDTIEHIKPYIRPGITTNQLDDMAKKKDNIIRRAVCFFRV